MAATATLNIRLPEDLKEHGMQVLEREGVSVSELVRELFRELAETQELPDFARDARSPSRQEECDRRRAALRAMSGIAPSAPTLEEARRARLEEKCAPGVRL